MLEFSIKKIKPYGDEREIDAFIIEAPYQALSIIKTFSDLEEIDYFIEWLKEDIINADIPDYSFENGIEFQPILFGSKWSKIAEYVDSKIIGGQEFDTQKFLELCQAWRKFLESKHIT